MGGLKPEVAGQKRGRFLGAGISGVFFGGKHFMGMWGWLLTLACNLGGEGEGRTVAATRSSGKQAAPLSKCFNQVIKS